MPLAIKRRLLAYLPNDCEALDAGARTGPSAMKTDGAITVKGNVAQQISHIHVLSACHGIIYVCANAA